MCSYTQSLFCGKHDFALPASLSLFFDLHDVQDPVKVVNKVVENITLANPDFNNPVGNFVYTMW